MDLRSRHFVFFTFPRFGHVRPTLPAVRLLVERGHRVSYVVPDTYSEAVADIGATPVPYASPFPAVVPPIDTVDGLSTVAAAYLREAFAPLRAAWGAFAGELVDLVVDDAISTVASRLVADRAGCPVVCTFAGVAGNDEVPLNGSEALPGDPEVDPAHPEFERLRTELPALLAELGLDQAEVERAAATAPAANLVFVPRSFQPHAERFDDSFVFVGPGALPEPTTGWTPPPDRRIALVSLGTCSDNPGFFDDCAAAFAGSGWHLVMTTAGRTPSVGAVAADDVEVHAFLDHAAVLPHADVQVCQAGAGALMDAFTHGVPVVAVPQQPDSRVVARQVEALGLGQVLIGDVTGESVRSAVASAAADTAMAARIRMMQEDIRCSGGAAAAVQALERLV